MIYKKVITGSTSRLTMVDHTETYGRHHLDKFVQYINVDKCIDIGCGGGADLSIVKKYHNSAKLYGIDFGLWNNTKLQSLGVEPIALDIEKDKLPFEDDSIDIVIANQVFEHTKEIFWINHEIFRCLKQDGFLFLGVPNVLSLHNRILMLFGFHPTCNKSTSAHIRVFSKRDVKSFYKNIGNEFCTVEKIYGAQFYPFPKSIARLLANIFPNLAVSSFYVIRKKHQYKGEFLEWPKHASLETNYFIGSY